MQNHSWIVALQASVLNKKSWTFWREVPQIKTASTWLLSSYSGLAAGNHRIATGEKNTVASRRTAWHVSFCESEKAPRRNPVSPRKTECPPKPPHLPRSHQFHPLRNTVGTTCSFNACSIEDMATMTQFKKKHLPLPTVVSFTHSVKIGIKWRTYWGQALPHASTSGIIHS